MTPDDLISRDAYVAGLEAALRELVAIVRAECPALLNEDSGGNGYLSNQIDDLLKGEKT